MKPHHKALFLGIIGMLVLDTAGSVLSNIFKFNYAYLAIISLFIYGAVGFKARKTSSHKTAIQSCALVGLVDATAGWIICTRLGANMGSFVKTPSPGIWLFTIINVMVLAGICGRIGAALVKGSKEVKAVQ